MPWTDQQIRAAVIACRKVGITEDHRKLILRQLPNSLFDAAGKPTGEPSSRSRRLNNSDLEQFMAVVERTAQDATIPGYSANYWQTKAADDLQRMRHLVRQLDDQLVAHEVYSSDGLANQVRRMTQRDDATLETCDYIETHKVINALRSMAQRHGLDVFRVSREGVQ